MARLIDADALLKQFSDCNFKGYVLKNLIKEQPTVDAVPVVRCKDCRKGAVTMVHEQKVVRCPYLERCMDLEGFCCFGERRTGNVR